MITLMRKELRELALPAVALVCCAVIIAGMDLMYNLYYPQYKGQGIALGIWLIISIAVAFLGGATAIARENRARTVFLSEWPVSRGALWVAKAAVSFVLTMAVIAAGFGACLLAAGLAHYEQITDLRDAAVNLAYVLPLCFAFGLLWSGLIGSVLGAGALGLVTLAALGSGLTWFLAFYLPARWGPYVDRPMYGLSPTLIWIGTTLVLLVGASAFVRYPVLEGKRRALVAVGLLVGLTVAAAVLLVGYKVVVWRPTLQQQVAEPGLSADGKTIYFRTAAESGDMRLRSSGLWVMPATGGRPRMVCRTGDAPLERLDNAATMQWKTGNVSAAYWAYDFGRGKLLQMAGLPIALSPDGRYRVTMEQRGVLVRDEQGRVVKA
ncbi:MAG TPA: ABC transporter permease, partial [Tepidisphaeraceae bacterium]|nr:ABC transporter permease [Tepidisphaeraceae bacterium]